MNCQLYVVNFIIFVFFCIVFLAFFLKKVLIILLIIIIFNIINYKFCRKINFLILVILLKNIIKRFLYTNEPYFFILILKFVKKYFLLNVKLLLYIKFIYNTVFNMENVIQYERI